MGTNENSEVRVIGIEVRKMHEARSLNGFYAKFMQGKGIDVGYRGLGQDCEPVFHDAIGIDLGSPGYDGLHLPFEDGTFDWLHASHVLEHIEKPIPSLQEWLRVLKVGGHMVLYLPHCYLYEKSFKVQGAWNSCDDHKRVYTPARLLTEIEEAFIPNTYRVVHFRDNDTNYDYSRPLNATVRFYDDCFEIECVLRKIQKPQWDVLK